MKAEFKMRLTEKRLGRAWLHLKCLACGGKWAWHLAGVCRELFSHKHHDFILVACFFSISHALAANPPGYYTDPFRPQYHFTPEKNWMNDPNGLVYYEGEYHLFYQYNPFGNTWGHMSWGHAVSPDMVHWKHLPLALPESDGVMIFSGSAVIDWNNTSGFGKDGRPPMVAIYTGNYTGKPLQNQNLAYSNDKGRTWTKYSGNPVLDIGATDFRDPKVFWHEPTHQWVMVVAWPLERKVRFYASPDLKHWSHLSDFGPAGATKGIWECPDLFPLTVEGNTNLTRWVLIVNLNPGGPAGGSGCQYFIGEFDGKHFVLDGSYPKSESAEVTAPPGKVLADFEGNDYGDWKTTGTAFGIGPSHPHGGVAGFVGKGLADSFGTGDGDQGTLTSPKFVIDNSYVSFLIGGGAHPGQLGMNLLINGMVAETATGNNAPSLKWQSWDVHKYHGQTAQLEIFDNYTNGDWGHIYVDQIILGNRPPKAAVETALWADYGPDFYAGVSWSDIPKSDGRRLWLGWMSNWQYGQDVPTSPWRSAMSVPRKLSLVSKSESLRLEQQPVTELNSLRQLPPLIFPGGNFKDAANWLAGQTNLPPLLDIEMTLTNVSNNSPFAVIIHIGQNQQTSVACEPALNQLIVDRRRSGLTAFNPDFAGRYSAPMHLLDGVCQLRLLLDTSSIETFAQDGTVVLSSLIFPNPETRSLSLTLGRGGEPYVTKIAIYKMKSAWRTEPSSDARR